jgi:hypothetical protein
MASIYFNKLYLDFKSEAGLVCSCRALDYSADTTFAPESMPSRARQEKSNDLRKPRATNSVLLAENDCKTMRQTRDDTDQA